jgi:serine/threonine protein kinase
MSPQRRRKIEQLYVEVLERAPGDREGFLSEACAGDEELRTGIQSLLAHNSGIAAPLPEDTGASFIGHQIAHYQIVEKLGEGGMGVVYRAIDIKLGRPVAVKILQSTAALDPDRQRRFLQEARSTSSLNHPNIVTIYEAGASGKIVYIAMELVSGRTLRDLAAISPIALRTALRYGAQIADALAAAHAAGIVHRDLKPANIMITERGLVKVLDFGLAKLIGLQNTSAHSLQTTQTIGPETIVGAIIGTPGYMSPEQAEGKPADRRSDIFALGAILYELATGKRAFSGESSVSTLAATLNKDPAPIRQLVPAAPVELERVVTQCLSKKPDARPQDADDVKVVLETLDVRFSPSASGSSRLTRPLVAALAVTALIAAGAAWFGFRSRPALPAERSVLTRLTSWPGLTAYPAVSPDGKTIAYASDRSGEGNLDIWLQQTGPGAASLRLTTGKDDDYEPSFSNDGTRIAYRSEKEGGGIYVVSTLGGDPHLVVREGRRPRYSPDGRLIAYWVGTRSPNFTNGSSATFVVPADGGRPRQIAAGFVATRYPVWLPDGRLLIVGRPNAPNATPDWWIFPVDGGPPICTQAFTQFEAQRLGAPPLGLELGLEVRSHGQYAVTPEMFLPGRDRVLFSATLGGTTNVWQVPLDLRTGLVNGKPEQLTFGTDLEVQASAQAAAQTAPALIFSALSLNVNVWSEPIDAKAGLPSGELQRVTNSLTFDAWPFVSRDGSHLVFASYESRRGRVVIRDNATGKEVVVADGLSGELQPVLSASGDQVAYADEKTLTSYIAGAGGIPEKLCDRCVLISDWMRDGSHVLAETNEHSSPVDLIDVHSHRRVSFLKSSNPRYLDFYSAHFSPDDRWVSFHAHTGSSRQIFIAPVKGETPPPEQEWLPITDGKNMDRNATWSADGNLLYFLSDRDRFRCIWGQRLDPVSRRPVGPAFVVQHFHDARRSLLALGENVGAVGLGATRDKLFFALGEVTGNIWLREGGDR